MNKSQCLTADWQTVGFEDGSTGKNQSHISEYRKDCAKHGISPDLARYQQGHFEGSKRFCTTRSGFLEGRNGNGYNRSCPEQFEMKFLAGFRDGQELHSLNQILNSAHSNLEHVVSKMQHIDELIVEKSELMIADGLVREQRLKLLEQIEGLKYEYAELDQELPYLQGQIDAAQADFIQAEQRFSSYLH